MVRSRTSVTGFHARRRKSRERVYTSDWSLLGSYTDVETMSSSDEALDEKSEGRRNLDAGRW